MIVVISRIKFLKITLETFYHAHLYAFIQCIMNSNLCFSFDIMNIFSLMVCVGRREREREREKGTRERDTFLAHIL